MAYNYDKLYGETPDALGSPSRQFTNFFETYNKRNADVLDVGCGQGRDALFIARLGHRVVGVDLSPNGIRDLTDAAQRENIDVHGVVATLQDYTPDQDFDVVVIDRTLHMLDIPTRLGALARLLDHVKSTGHVLISDETSNIGGFKRVIANHHHDWTATRDQKGYLFIQRTS